MAARRAWTHVREAFAKPPAPFRSRLAVTIDGLDVDHPELQGLNLNDGDAETCERAFDRLMERNVINFAEGSPRWRRRAVGCWNALASVALRCDRFSIEVAGHTDNTGDRDLNMDLSRGGRMRSRLISPGKAWRARAYPRTVTARSPALQQRDAGGRKPRTGASNFT
ncbi:MAG: hypothetical protein IPG56_18885 [Caulobacteraceae bacterium]|nr:hypothetical protein [Caulobacteraceae bacterium]